MWLGEAVGPRVNTYFCEASKTWHVEEQSVVAGARGPGYIRNRNRNRRLGLSA
jgi:hypothetical protein